MRTCLILETLHIGTNWVTSLLKWKRSFSPLLPSDFFYHSSVNKAQNLLFPLLWTKILYNELIQDSHNFVLAVSFLWSFPLAGNTLPLIPNIACLFLDLLRRKKKWISWSSLQCSMTCLIIQSPWLAAKGYKNNFWVTIPHFFSC